MNNNVFLSLKQGIINTERDKIKSQKEKEIQYMTEEGKSFLKKKVKEKERRRQVISNIHLILLIEPKFK